MKHRLTSVAVCAECTSAGVTFPAVLVEPLPPPEPDPNRAVPTTAIPMAAPSRCAVMRAARRARLLARHRGQHEVLVGRYDQAVAEAGEQQRSVSAQKSGLLLDRRSTSAISAGRPAFR